MKPEMLLVYDRECPVCEAYCRAVRRHGLPAGLQLVDARGDHKLLTEISRRGLNIDEGMVLAVDGVIHHGAEAVQTLVGLGGARGFFNRCNRALFGSARRARRLYPPLRAARSLLLKLLRRPRINNLPLRGREGAHSHRLSR